MSRKKRELPELKNIEITGLAAEGKSFAKIKLKEDNEKPMVIFIPFGAPGDIVNIKIDKRKHNFCEAHITALIKPSPIRKVPNCNHFSICGGCRWQHLPYDIQLTQKKQQVIDAFERIGKLEFPKINDTLGSLQIWNYRNKMEYSFSSKKWRTWEEINTGKEFYDTGNALGFHIPGCFDKVLHIKNCQLQEDIGNQIRNFIFDYAENYGYSFYNIKENHGLLRTLMIRIASTGQILVCLTFGEDNQTKIEVLLKAIIDKFPQISSLVYVVNKKLNDSIADQEVNVFYGNNYIEEKMEDLIFRINTKSFYQTNSHQALTLYKTAKNFADLENFFEINGRKPIVYDLYTGAGTIANFVADKSEKVIGIEYVKEAIEDAKINSSVNNIKNTHFFAGDMKDILNQQFIETNGKPDIMIIDPPRAGMHEDVVKVILETSPKTIVYVSCNPATQARDIALLKSKYEITEIQPVDMFPHTHHVENVAKLILKNE